jgi:hypothetical protein
VVPAAGSVAIAVAVAAVLVLAVMVVAIVVATAFFASKKTTQVFRTSRILPSEGHPQLPRPLHAFLPQHLKSIL